MAFGDFTVDRNSTKYVLGSGGDIISYATDQPAFEFNADGSYKGLLVEPAATNICLQSQDFSTTWFKNGGTVTGSQADPEGNTNAYLLEGDGSSTFVQANQNLTLTAGKNTISVFAKKGTNNYLQIAGDSFTSATDVQGFFDLDAGTTASTGATITEYPNGWYRCTVTPTIDAGDLSGIIRFRCSYSDTVPNFPTAGDANGQNIYLWGAQVETGPIATSYIPTTTASVTRNKDDINLTSASSLIGQTEGTLYVEVDWRATSGTGQILLEVNDGASGDRILIFNYGAGDELRMLAAAGGNAKTDQGVSSSAYSGIQKIAFAYADADFELYRNGSSISSDTVGSLAALATLTDIDLGQDVNSGQQANMHIRAVALFTRRLTDAEAIALTTL